MKDNFYREFEERHYAPREQIKELRKKYLPFVAPLSKLYRGESTYDAGCGRGEWLELMSEMGFTAFGVDLDEGMLEACIERKLDAKQGDAVNYIRTLDNESQVIVSAFHVVEHISFEDLQSLVLESLRVLKPGGLLIMETPNPENIEVATNNFYLDPTHIRPIPPRLLKFLPEFHGFSRVKVLRLQEAEVMHTKTKLTLLDVLKGVSPDYAVVAQKMASPEVLKLNDGVFGAEYGVSLEDLSRRYDARVAAIELENSEIKQIMDNVINSTAWKMLAPLRKVDDVILNARTYGIRNQFKMAFKKIILNIGYLKQRILISVFGMDYGKGRLRVRLKMFLGRIFYSVFGRPAIKRRLITYVNKFPSIKTGLRAWFFGSEAVDESLPDSLVLEDLSSRARQVYDDLSSQAVKEKN